MPGIHEKAHCYGQRMLNPFHGVLNAIEIDGADAVTRDGVEWSLYLKGENEAERLEDGSECVFSTPDIKFGTWSVSGGLKRAPVRAVVDYEHIEWRGLRLLDCVKRFAPLAPFPLRDLYELWLLDAATGLPLALIDSACDMPESDQGEARWRPGECCKREFYSPALEAIEPNGEPPAGAGHGLRIEALINGAAGPQPVSQWFTRAADGSGRAIGVNHLRTDNGSRRLPAYCFPELLLSSRWQTRHDRALATDFTHWQAPWLLQLQQISPATRERLEASACRQAARTAATHRLYPEVIDRARLNAALVASRLSDDRRAAVTTDGQENLATFYIEL